jgi:hypothetical protein
MRTIIANKWGDIDKYLKYSGKSDAFIRGARDLKEYLKVIFSRR